MRILYLSQYFPPENGATQARAHDMAKALAAAGHSVTVICEFPNHPSGRMPARYRGRVYEKTTLDGIEVIRVWVKASPVKSFGARLGFYLSYFGSAVLAGLMLARGRWDLIYATSPPLFAGAAGLALSQLRRTPLVFEVRDIWPAAAVALGELSHPRAIRVAQWLEAACYRRARRIVTVTEGAGAYLIRHGVPEDRILLIPNGADTNRFFPQPAAGARLRQALGLQDAFVVLFAGLHGLAQDLDTLLATARRLVHREDIRFVFVGEGPEKAALIAQAQVWGLSNVLFHPEIDRDRVPAFLAMADLAAVPMRKAGLLETTIPLRIYDAWACGCPTLVAGTGEVFRLQNRARAGLTVAPGDVAAFADALLWLRARPDVLAAMGANGRRFVRAHRSRAVLGARLAGHLAEIVAD